MTITGRCYRAFGLHRKRLSKTQKGLVLLLTLSVSFLFLTRRKNQHLQIWEYEQNIDSLEDNHCQIPKLSLYDDTIQSYFKVNKKIKCSDDIEVVVVRGGKIEIANYYKDTNITVACDISYIYRDGDFNLKYSPVERLDITSSLDLKWDFFKAVCKDAKGYVIYKNIHAGISRKPHLNERFHSPKEGLGMDVMMFGFDSVSHLTFIRKLPKTYAYFTDVLGGLTLNGYNIVGDGTPQALIPMLTGQTEIELPSTLKREFKLDRNETYFVDVYPMIWKDFANKGYVTLWAEDMQEAATFQYRMRGFDKQPTDYYMRPFQLQVLQDRGQHNAHCLASKPRHKVFYNWIRDFCDLYRTKSKFLFSFLAEVSHNSVDYLQNADEDMYSLLQYLNLNGHLNNTILVLFADHGMRIGDIRTTLQGKQEERLPMMGFAFPSWFKSKYPIAFKNYKTNIDRLSSPFDIYATLKDVMHYHEHQTLDNKHKRSISLFQEINKNRTCEDSNIASHWCACLKWYTIDKSEPNIQNAGAAIVEHINKLTEERRDLCSVLHLNEVTKALSLLPDKAFLKFQGSKDIHGRMPDFGGTTKISDITLQITVRTQPGNGLFEVSLVFKPETHSYVIHSPDISRINKYGDAPKCILQYKKDLRKYCYCKHQ